MKRRSASVVVLLTALSEYLNQTSIQELTIP
jgi:hypothetical protein